MYRKAVTVQIIGLCGASLLALLMFSLGQNVAAIILAAATLTLFSAVSLYHLKNPGSAHYFFVGRLKAVSWTLVVCGTVALIFIGLSVAIESFTS